MPHAHATTTVPCASRNCEDAAAVSGVHTPTAAANTPSPGTQDVTCHPSTLLPTPHNKERPHPQPRSRLPPRPHTVNASSQQSNANTSNARGRPKCTHDGCDNVVYARGKCGTHFPRATKCAHNGCDNQVVARGKCGKHCGRPKCAHNGCDNQVVARGKCGKHDERGRGAKCAHQSNANTSNAKQQKRRARKTKEEKEADNAKRREQYRANKRTEEEQEAHNAKRRERDAKRTEEEKEADNAKRREQYRANKSRPRPARTEEEQEAHNAKRRKRFANRTQQQKEARKKYPYASKTQEEKNALNVKQQKRRDRAKRKAEEEAAMEAAIAKECEPSNDDGTKLCVGRKQPKATFTHWLAERKGGWLAERKSGWLAERKSGWKEKHTSKPVKREKRSERVIQKCFRELRRMTHNTGTNLEGRLFSKTTKYHGSRVPPSAMDKSHGTIVKIKPLRQVKDITKKQLNLWKRDDHGSVYFTYSIYQAITHAKLCNHGPLEDSAIYVYSVTVENDLAVQPVGLTDSNRWKSEGCTGLWKTPENASIIDVMKMQPGSKGNFSDPDSIIQVFCADGDVSNDSYKDLKPGMKGNSEHYCDGSFCLDDASDDESLGIQDTIMDLPEGFEEAINEAVILAAADDEIAEAVGDEPIGYEV